MAPFWVFPLFLSRIVAHSVIPIPSESQNELKLKFDDYSQHFLLPEDFVHAANKPVSLVTSELLDSVQNSQLFEGDIVGIPEDSVTNKRLRDQPISDDEIFTKPYHSALNLMTYPDKLWTNGEVPYMLEEGMTNDQRAAIAQAFDEYKEKTCIRFIPRTDDHFDYIYVKRNVAFGCSSYVGRAGGNQTVSLEVDKCFQKGIIAHELMHALGFFHEHSRTDRDDYVDIKEDHIRPGMMRNFEKYPKKIIDPLGMPYDYGSVMHYHKLAFSRNGKSTIVPKDEHAEIGQRYRLSEIDAKKVNKLYKCEEKEKNKTSTSTSTSTSTTTTTTTERTTTEEEERQRPELPKTTSTTRKSTTTSTTTERPTTKKTDGKKEKCEDLNAHCRMWEQLGHCNHSVKYMAHYCRKACKLCDIEPPTTTKEVTKSTRNNKVEKETKGREKEKKPAEKCEDKNLFCGYWAKIGECKSESKFMKVFCKASCKRC